MVADSSFDCAAIAMFAIDTPDSRFNFKSWYICNMRGIEERIFNINSGTEFDALALDIFHLQAAENNVYAAFLDHLGIDHTQVNSCKDIPFLPIELFKSHRVITGNRAPTMHFESSGTTGQLPSRHYLVSEAIYRESFVRTFTANYGNPETLCILALLPSYMERGNASLVYMMDHLTGLSKHPDSGFYLDDLEGLSSVLQKRIHDGQATLLLGVSFALLDLAEKFPQQMSPNIIIMETGGMKGRRKEMIREELHEILQKAFLLPAGRNQGNSGQKRTENECAEQEGQGQEVPGNKAPGTKADRQVTGEKNFPGQEHAAQEAGGQKITRQEIHSEYGMTELLSQAYAKDGKRFRPPPWMRAVTRDLYDPLTLMPPGRSGGINVIDLANLYSCSFIATGDLGRVYPDGAFEITGRFDQAEVRGCNLMVV